jgi:hypothetical protein
MDLQPRETPKPSNHFSRKDWLLFLMPFLLFAVTIAYVTVSITLAQSQPAVEIAAAEAGQFSIKSIASPTHGILEVEVVNGTEDVVTIPQVIVDDAYWGFEATPSNTIAAGNAATLTIPYPWVANERNEIRLITSQGATFDGEIVPSVDVSPTNSLP